jgi:hypothetical protein
MASEGKREVMKLTEENVGRLNTNNCENNEVRAEAALGPQRGEAQWTRTAASVEVLAGDPVLDAEGEMVRDVLLSPPLVEEDFAEELVEKGDPMDELIAGEPPASEQQQDGLGLKAGMGVLLAKTHEGRLSAKDRKGSDWSESTAKP